MNKNTLIALIVLIHFISIHFSLFPLVSLQVRKPNSLPFIKHSNQTVCVALRPARPISIPLHIYHICRREGRQEKMNMYKANKFIFQMCLNRNSKPTNAVSSDSTQNIAQSFNKQKFRFPFCLVSVPFVMNLMDEYLSLLTAGHYDAIQITLNWVALIRF